MRKCRRPGQRWGRAGTGGRGDPGLSSLSFLPHRWNVPHSESYALKFADGHKRYITENVSPLPAPPYTGSL